VAPFPVVLAAVLVSASHPLSRAAAAALPVGGGPRDAAFSQHAVRTPEPEGPQACTADSYECALTRVERHEFEAAIPTLRRILSESPRELKALNLLGIALTGAGRLAEANASFLDALAIDPDFYPARKNLAINQLTGGERREAKRHLERVLAQAPRDEIAHVHLAEILYADGQLAAALQHFEKAGARATANPRWVVHHAACLIAQGETARAVTALERLPPADAESRFEAGVILGRAGLHTDAARFFGSARSHFRDPYAASYNEILMWIEAGRHADALRVASDVFARGPQPAELYNLVSRAYVGAGRVQEAYDSLRTAIRMEPSAEQHYIDLALICIDHENYDLGLEIVDVGLHYRPDAGALHLQKGVLYVMKGLVEQAEDAFERARALMPDSPAPPVALAMAWMQSGRTDRAVDLLRERSGANAPHAIVPYMFGIALMRSGVDPSSEGGAEAARAFEAAVGLDPQLSGARAELGKILLKRGSTGEAIDQLQQAVHLDADNVAAAYALAQAYRSTGRVEQAQELLARVSRLNAQERGDDPDGELKRLVVRIVREGSAPPPAPAPQP
jgi:tetratricopeptide (TPR) repeat protein